MLSPFTETEKQVGQLIIQYNETMALLTEKAKGDNDMVSEEAKGKQAVLLIMLINDIELIYKSTPNGK